MRIIGASAHEIHAQAHLHERGAGVDRTLLLREHQQELSCADHPELSDIQTAAAYQRWLQYIYVYICVLCSGNSDAQDNRSKNKDEEER